MLDQAYKLGAAQALADFEKEANLLGALGGVGKAIWNSKPMWAPKFLTGMGGRGSQFIGMPLGGGILGAAMAEDGERMKGFAGGVVGGALGGVGMHFGGKIFKNVAQNIGKSMGATATGGKMWQGLGKLNPNYGANQLAKHEASMAKGVADHAEKLKNLKPGEVLKPFKPTKFTGDATHSLGQHAAKKWLPGAAGLGGGFAGYSMLEAPGNAVGSSLAPALPNMGSFSPRGAFNPVQ